MKLFRILLSFVFIVAAYLSIYPITASAVGYDLIAPSGTLSRDQDVQFIVNIDSEGTSIKSAEIGMTYQSQYLQYVSTTPGDAMTSVTATPTADGTLMLSGTNSSGFNSAGVFAYVTFKIIATGPGIADICALFSPSTTPTPAPTTVAPTQLPQTGTVENTRLATFVGFVLLLSSVASLAMLKRPKSGYSHKKH